MDAIDKKILCILSKRSNISATEISGMVNLSVPAVNKRIQKLSDSGVIRSFTVLTDPAKMEKSVMAFILLVLQYRDGAANLMQCVENDPDILECYAVTGEYDYIIKVCVSGVEALEDKLLMLKKQKGVVKSHTMLSLMEHKFEPTVLPCADS